MGFGLTLGNCLIWTPSWGRLAKLNYNGLWTTTMTPGDWTLYTVYTAAIDVGECTLGLQTFYSQVPKRTRNPPVPVRIDLRRRLGGFSVPSAPAGGADRSPDPVLFLGSLCSGQGFLSLCSDWINSAPHLVTVVFTV